MSEEMKLVPIEPTKAMIDAALETFGGIVGTPENLANTEYVERMTNSRRKAIIGHYKAMLSAAPAHADEPVALGNLRKGAERLEDTRQNAEFWFDAGQSEPDRAKAVMHVAQAMFAWKNAAYGLSEELAAAARPSAGIRSECIAVITKCQELLAAWIVPDSGISDHDVLNSLLGVLDDEKLVKAIRALGESS